MGTPLWGVPRSGFSTAFGGGRSFFQKSSCQDRLGTTVGRGSSPRWSLAPAHGAHYDSAPVRCGNRLCLATIQNGSGTVHIQEGSLIPVLVSCGVRRPDALDLFYSNEWADTSAVNLDKSRVAHSRFKQHGRSGDATRPSVAGRSPDDSPENVPCQPLFAFPARGAFALRDIAKDFKSTFAPA